MIVNCFYVAYNYPAAMFMLWRGFRRQWMNLVSLRIHGCEPGQQVGWLDRLHGYVKSTLGGTVMGERLLTVASWGVYLIWTLMASEALDVIEVVIWFGFGIEWIKEDRDLGRSLMESEQRKTEDSWGFGQLVPVILLFLPIMQFAESYANHCYAEARERELRDMRRNWITLPNSDNRVKTI